MRSAFRKSVIIVLAASYALVTAAGNLVLLRELLGSGDKNYRLTSEQQSHPLPGSPVWTVKSPLMQILHADQSIHITPAETIVNPNRLPQSYQFPQFQSKYTYLECLPSKPRDPPLA